MPLGRLSEGIVIQPISFMVNAHGAVAMVAAAGLA